MWSPMRKHLRIAESGYLGEWHAFPPVLQRVTGTGNNELVVFFGRPAPQPGRSHCPGKAGVGFRYQRVKVVPRMKELWPDLLGPPSARCWDHPREHIRRGHPAPRIDTAVTRHHGRCSSVMRSAVTRRDDQ